MSFHLQRPAPFTAVVLARTWPSRRSALAAACLSLSCVGFVASCGQDAAPHSGPAAGSTSGGAPATQPPQALSPVRAALEDGVRLANEGKYPEAVAAFERGVRLEPENAKLRHELGVVLIKLGSSLRAEAEFTAGIEAEPGGPDNWYDRSIARMQLGRLADAEKDLLQALALNPKHAIAEYNLGFLLESQALVVLGSVTQDTDKLQRAVAAYQRALALEPGFDGARARLGLVLSRLHRTDEARQVLVEVLAKSPDQPLALLERVRLECESGEFEAATPLLERLLKVQPENHEAHYFAGTLAEERGHTADARAAYQRAVELFPGYSVGWFRLAATLEQLGDAPAAAKARERFSEVEKLASDVSEKQAAINSQPGNPRLRYELARALARAQRIDESLLAYNQTLAIEPKYPGAWFEAGVLQLEKKQDAKAARLCFETTLTYQPNNPLAHALAGRACLALKDLESAQEHLQVALQGAPDFVEAMADLGVVYTLQGKLIDAIATLEAGAAKAPQHTRVLYNLGGAYFQRGDAARARASYQKVLTIDPEHAGAKQRLVDIAEAEARRASEGADHPQAATPNAAPPVQNGDTKAGG
jgi:superkiller protein 3